MIKHLLWAILAASIAAFCAWNVYRGFRGLPMFLFMKYSSGWYDTEGLGVGLYWFFMTFLAAVGVTAAGFAWHQIRVWLKG